MRIIIILIALSIFSCRSIQYVPVETVKTEKEYIDKIKRDSIYVREFSETNIILCIVIGLCMIR